MNKEEMTFRELTEEWIETIRLIHTQKSLDDTQRDLRFLLEDIGNMKLSEFTIDFIKNYFDMLDTRTFETGYASAKRT